MLDVDGLMVMKEVHKNRIDVRQREPRINFKIF